MTHPNRVLNVDNIVTFCLVSLLLGLASGCEVEDSGNLEQLLAQPQGVKSPPLHHRGSPDDLDDQDPGAGFDLDDPDLCECLESPSDCEQYDDLSEMQNLTCDRCCDGTVCGLDESTVDKACGMCADYDSPADCPTSVAVTTGNLCPDPGNLHFESCDCWLKDDAQDAADWLVANWTDFSTFAEGEGGLNMTNCVRNRLDGDSNIQCQATAGSNECPTNASVGFARPFMTRIFICPGFTDDVNTTDMTSSDERQACLMGIMAHEFGHTCLRGETSTELLGRLAFEYFVMMEGINLAFWECGM